MSVFHLHLSRGLVNKWLITRFVTRLTRCVPLVEQELLTLPEYLSSPPVFCWVRVTRSLVLCVCFVHRLCSFVLLLAIVLSVLLLLAIVLSVLLLLVIVLSVLLLLAIVLSVLLRFTDSDYPFGIFKLFLKRNLLNQVFLNGKLKSSFRKFYDRHNVLVKCYGIS